MGGGIDSHHLQRGELRSSVEVPAEVTPGQMFTVQLPPLASDASAIQQVVPVTVIGQPVIHDPTLAKAT